ncbi:MAG TPA: flippase activity-associated protein Agl23 [Pyrinomonadaceae bacterium]
MSGRTWRISAAAILAVGTALRLVYLTLVPLHHDEGVNGNFLVSLVRNGTYTYDPNNYHGPTLYYFAAVAPWLARFVGGVTARDKYGLTTFNVRFVTAAFGVATIGLALLLRKRLGSIGALSAAALIAISPGAVYLSRYFIHESLFVFFMLGIVVAALKYYDTGAGVYLILVAISAALMTATKETWIINGPVLLIALLTTSLYFWLRGRLSGEPRANGDGEFLARFGGPVSVATIALVAFTVFIVVNVLFYSSFFQNYPKGVNDALQTLSLWRKRTVEHAHPWWQYTYWLLQEEGIVVVLGGIAALIAVWRADNRLAVFLALWSFGLLIAYSMAGMSVGRLVSDLIFRHTITEQTYKTPWICLNFIIPLALTAGYALDVFYQKLREYEQPYFFLAPAALIVAFCGYQMYQLNFVHYDDDKYAYVYAHTRRETLVMLEQIDRAANQLKTGYDTGVAIVSPEYWPLPWYFRDYKRVGYYGKVVPTSEPIIIGQTGQEEEINATFGEQYQQIDSSKLSDPRIFLERDPNGSFSLRPGVDLLLYVRRDVAR